MLLTAIGGIVVEELILAKRFVAGWALVTKASLLADARNYCTRIVKRLRLETCNRLVDKILWTPPFWPSVCVAK